MATRGANLTSTIFTRTCICFNVLVLWKFGETLSSLANLKSLASANVFKYLCYENLVSMFKFHAEAKLSLMGLCQVWQIWRVWRVQMFLNTCAMKIWWVCLNFMLKRSWVWWDFVKSGKFEEIGECKFCSYMHIFLHTRARQVWWVGWN
jgi:hypothetical protein